MTKRKTPTKQAPQASAEDTESVKQESNTKVASKSKRATTTTVKKASTGGRRGRPKKVVVDKPTEAVDRLVRKAADVGSPIITYVDPVVMAVKQEPEPSLYDRFVGWLTYKLYQITSPFRGY